MKFVITFGRGDAVLAGRLMSHYLAILAVPATLFRLPVLADSNHFHFLNVGLKVMHWVVKNGLLKFMFCRKAGGANSLPPHPPPPQTP